MARRRQVNNPNTIEYWQEQISQCENSGLSQRKYCKKNDIVYTSFCYWRLRIRKMKEIKTQPSPTFKQAIFEPSPSPAQPLAPLLIKVELPSRTKLEIPATLGQEELSTIFKFIGALI